MARRRREFGSIRRLPSGRFQARWWDESSGVHVPATITFRTRADAAGWLAATQVRADQRDRPAIPGTVTVESYALDWLATRPLRPRTEALYRSQLDRPILPTFGATAVRDLAPAEVRRWYADRSRSGLSPVSVAKLYRLLRSILATAVGDELISRNPCQIKGGGTERSPERPIPTIATVAALAENLPADLGAVPWVAALAGLRRGELFALARRHVDLGAAVIRVERAIQEVRGHGAVFVEPKTTSSVRDVAIPGRLVTILDTHLTDHVGPDRDDLVFTNGAGRPVRASVWTPLWKHANATAGVDVRLHDLRHLAGTLAAQAGATLRETMDRLGHSSPQAALRYQHVADRRPAQIARAIDDLINADPA